MAVDFSELSPERRRHTLSFYLVFLILVVPLSSTLPTCWLFVIYSLYSRNILFFSSTWKTLFLIALCEVFFSLYWYHLCRVVARPAPCGPGNLAEIEAAYQRLLKVGLAELPEDEGDEESKRPGSPEEDITQLEQDDPRAVDFRNCLRKWFCKVPISSLRHHQVQQWLYWTIANSHMSGPIDSLPDSYRNTLHWAFELLQKRAGFTFQEGSDPDVQPMRLTIDDIHPLWRPLTLYVSISVINYLLKCWYVNGYGARCRQYDGLEYLVRIPKHWNSATGPRPIVFIHGLCVGLLQYHMTILDLFTKCSDRPVLILLQPHISQDIFHPKYLQPMSRHQVADRLVKLLQEFGWVDSPKQEKATKTASASTGRQGVTLISHSNGSFVHAWILKSYSKMIVRSCFIDPVTFLLWEGDLCYNFFYRPCRTAFEIIMRYFVASEIGIINLNQRHFDWASNSLFFEEIPNGRDPTKTYFAMGGKDSVFDSERVLRYLTSHGVKKKSIFFDPNGIHGQALTFHGHKEIFRWLQEPDY